MTTTGGCYCGEIRYEADGEPVMKGECHCRECQYLTGGQANDFMAMPTAGFRYTNGEPKEASSGATSTRRGDAGILRRPAGRKF
jgi:hypothetical protein